MRRIRNRSLRDRLARAAVLILFTVLLVLGLALFVSGTVWSGNEEDLLADEESLRALEQEYVSQIRDYLEEQGFKNSGVTLTWIMEEDGSRSYEVVLYHKAIGKLSQEKRELLFAAVKKLAFQVVGCNFQVNLLV